MLVHSDREWQASFTLLVTDDNQGLRLILFSNISPKNWYVAEKTVGLNKKNCKKDNQGQKILSKSMDKLTQVSKFTSYVTALEDNTI